MATWAIGDVHGCHRTLASLVDRLDLAPGRDRLWLVGDVVNRGAASLETLAWLHARRAQVVMVLGNHDLRLLMAARGLVEARADDTLEAIVSHPEREVWLGWLAQQPLVHVEGAHLMVHAGLLPAWGDEVLTRTLPAAQEALRGAGAGALLAALARRPRDLEANGVEGLAAHVAAVTQVRMVDAMGRPLWGYVGTPAAAPAGARPWFTTAAPAAGGRCVVFGHWSALGLYRGPDAIGLDSGCVWGRQLTAWRLEDDVQVSEPCHACDGPRPLAEASGGG